MMKSHVVFMLSFFFNIINATSDARLEQMFKYYQLKYNRAYINEKQERIAFHNFVKNWNNLQKVNDDSLNSTFYILGRYADIDPAAMLEHYAVTVRPFGSEPKGNIRADVDAEKKRFKEELALENVGLFDLTRADELYKRYKNKFHKITPESKYDQQVHYLRFVKTLVDLNRNHFKGGDEDLDSNADEIKNPDEFFY